VWIFIDKPKPFFGYEIGKIGRGWLNYFLNTIELLKDIDSSI